MAAWLLFPVFIHQPPQQPTWSLHSTPPGLAPGSLILTDLSHKGLRQIYLTKVSQRQRGEPGPWPPAHHLSCTGWGVPEAPAEKQHTRPYQEPLQPHYPITELSAPQNHELLSLSHLICS